jgi:PAS domain S-box-containing protein
MQEKCGTGKGLPMVAPQGAAAALLAALIESTTDLIWSVDLDYRLTSFNKALSDHIRKNYGNPTALGMGPFDLLTQDWAALWPLKYDRALKEGPYRTEYALLDGRWLELNFNPIIQDGEKVGVAVFGKEITERKIAEQMLQEAEKKYRNIFDGALEGIFQTTEEGQLLTVNPALAQMLGYDSPQEIMKVTGHIVQDLWNDPQERVRYIESLKESHLIKGYECQLKRKDGTPIWISLNTRLVPGADGKTHINEGFIADITERKRSEFLLRQREGLLNETGEMAKVGGWELEPDAGRLTWTREVCRIHEVEDDFTPTLERAIGFYAPESKPVIEQAVSRAIEHDEPFDVELEIITARNHRLWVRALGRIRTRPDGVRVLSGTFQDITERKLTEAQLRDSEERYRSTFEQAAVGIVHTSMDGRLLRCNPRFAEIIGYPIEEVPGLTFQQITAPEDLTANVDISKQVWSGASPNATWEKRYIRKDGSFIWSRLTTSVQHDHQGRPLHFITVAEDISAQKAAEQQLLAARETLRTSELHYRTVFETSIDGKVISRLDNGRFIDVNQEYLDMIGFRREEVIGRISSELNVWVDENTRSDMIEALLRDTSIRDRRFRYRRKNGEIFWIQVSATVVDLDGVPCMFSACRDISEAKAAEDRLALSQEALRVSEEHYRTIFQSSLVLLALTRLADGVYVDVNKTYLETMGYESCELIGHSAIELNVWGDLRDRERVVELLRQHKECRNFETELRKKDGEVFPVLLSASMIQVGGVECILNVMRDISEMRAAEDLLRNAEQKFHQIFADAPEGIFQTSKEGKSLALNPAGANLLGYTSPEEAVSHISNSAHDTWLDPKERARYSELLEQHGEIHDFPCQLKRTDGTTIWISLSARKICGADGQTLYYQGFMQDLTKRRAAEEAIRKAETRFREIFEDAPEGIFQTSPEGTPFALNPAGAKLLGYESSEQALSEIANATHDLWLNPKDRARYIALLDEQEVLRDFQCQFKRRDGTPVWISLTARKVLGPDGKTLYYQGFNEDITEQKRLEFSLNAKIRELELLREINNAMLRASNEQDLLTEYCRIVVETGGYRMAWVGFAEDGPGKPVVPVAHFGYEEGYLKTLNLSWDETEKGSRGPTGRAIRMGSVQVTEDIATDPEFELWRSEAARRGYGSSIALPFHYSGASLACLTAYGAVNSVWSESEQRLMVQIALGLGFGITHLRSEIAREQSQEKLRTSLEETIQVIAETVEQRDPYTAGHQRRVSELCSRIAEKMGLSEDRTHGLLLAANIHDLGKIGIPAELLSKPGRLSAAQFALVKEHVQLGYEIIKNVHFPWPIGTMILQHHERMDGSGYPQGLKANEILLESRILAVADVVEAMSEHRPYRASKGIDKALDEVLDRGGILYDAEVADACVRVFREDGYKFPV